MKKECATKIEQYATQLLAELHNSKEPVLITEFGQPSAYLVSVEEFEEMQNRINILEGVERGEAAIIQGRTYSHTQAKNKMSHWLK